jgi:Symplekin tight junction protein C terminal
MLTEYSATIKRAASESSLSDSDRWCLLEDCLAQLLRPDSPHSTIDALCETFLDLATSTLRIVRLFTSDFILKLCEYRSVYATRCLLYLDKLLSDCNDGVLESALGTVRVVYPLAIYWISVQQKDPNFHQAAASSTIYLERILAKVIVLLKDDGSAFLGALKACERIILCQSPSNQHPRSQAHLELSGCSCLEDLRITDQLALDQGRLRVQADKLVEFLCSSLIQSVCPRSVRNLEEICRVLGSVAYERQDYVMAVVLCMQEFGSDCDHRLKHLIEAELRNILASRTCIKYHAAVLNAIRSLGQKATISVFGAEIQRLRQRLSKAAHESHLTIDDEHVAAVCSVKAQDASELAKVAIALLSKLPSYGSLEKETKNRRIVRVLSGRVLEYASSDWLPVSEGPQTMDQHRDARDYSQLLLRSRSFHSELYSRKSLLEAVSACSAEEIKELLQADLRMSRSRAARNLLLSCRASLTSVEFETLAFDCLGGFQDFNMLSELVRTLPMIPPGIIQYLEKLARSDDPSTRRPALSLIYSLFLTNPGTRHDFLGSLLRIASSSLAAASEDASDLIVQKVYIPLIDPKKRLDYFRGLLLEKLVMCGWTHQIEHEIQSFAPIGYPESKEALGHLFGLMCTRNVPLFFSATIPKDKAIISRVLRVILESRSAQDFAILLESRGADSYLVSIILELVHCIHEESVKRRLVKFGMNILKNEDNPESLVNAFYLLPLTDISDAVLRVIRGRCSGPIVLKAITNAIDILLTEKPILACLVSDIIRLGSDNQLLPSIMECLNHFFLICSGKDIEGVLRLTLLNVVEQDLVPAPFIRFMIQAAQSSPGNIEAFIASDVLPKLLKDNLVNDPVHWRGLTMLIILLLTCSSAAAKSKTAELCCNLPPAKASDLIMKRHDIRAYLRDFLSKQPFGSYTDIRRLLLE